MNATAFHPVHLPRGTQPHTGLPRLMAEHDDINSAIAELQTWCREVAQLGAPRINELGVRLGRLRKLLAEHFALEEHDGYMVEVVQSHPETARRVGTLLAQHSDLLQQLDGLIDRLCRPDPDFDCWSRAVGPVNALLQDLHDHERQETVLLQSALAIEAGVGD